METPDFEPGRVYFKQLGAERVSLVFICSSCLFSRKTQFSEYIEFILPSMNYLISDLGVFTKIVSNYINILH